jgi:hypothetical protein
MANVTFITPKKELQIRGKQGYTKTRQHAYKRKTRQDETSGREDKRTATNNKANEYKRSIRPRENQTRQDKTRHGEDEDNNQDPRRDQDKNKDLRTKASIETKKQPCWLPKTTDHIGYERQ